MSSPLLTKFRNPDNSTCSVLAALATFFMATIASADVIVEHKGALDPTTEQWVDTGGNQPAGPVFADFGHDAWSIDDNSVALGTFRAYAHQLNGSQIANALSNGWSLSTRLRMIDLSDELVQRHS